MPSCILCFALCPVCKTVLYYFCKPGMAPDYATGVWVVFLPEDFEDEVCSSLLEGKLCGLSLICNVWKSFEQSIGV